MIFALENMTCGYQGVPVLSGISFSVSSGEILCILGPNGVGKTTLFKSMLGLLRPISGRVTVDGEDIAPWSNRKRARTIGYIPQSHVPPFPYSVLQVVTMGRVSGMGLFSAPSGEDYAAAEAVLGELQIESLKDRIYTELSGGERQMVLIARALAQDPRILLMDEPTANLDYGNQARVLAQIRRLAERGMTVVMTTHSPDHAFLCSSKVAMVERGNRVTFGDAESIVTKENLDRMYGVDVFVMSDHYRNRTVRACVPVLEDEAGEENSLV